MPLAFCVGRRRKTAPAIASGHRRQHIQSDIDARLLSWHAIAERRQGHQQGRRDQLSLDHSPPAECNRRLCLLALHQAGASSTGQHGQSGPRSRPQARFSSRWNPASGQALHRQHAHRTIGRLCRSEHETEYAGDPKPQLLRHGRQPAESPLPGLDRISDAGW